MTDEFMIGHLVDTVAGMDTLKDLLSRADIPIDPDWEWTPYTGFVELGDGSRKGIGAPTATWHWSGLTQQQRQVLRSYCPDGISNTVYIRTKTNEFDPSAGEYIFRTYEAEMYWPPTNEQHDAMFVTDFALEFHYLVQQS